MTSVGTVLTVVAFVVVAVGAYAVGPMLVTRARASRPATGTYARRSDRLRERAGLDAAETYILAVKEDDRAVAYVRGPPTHRVLFVSEHLYDAFDDEVLLGLLAAQAGEADVWYQERRTAGLALLGATFLAALATGVATNAASVAALFAAFVVALHVVFPAYCRRLVHAADGVAADRVGADVVADALAAVEEGHDDDGPARYLRFRPPRSARLARLRERARGEA
jgi:STE24 endopeptidase